MILKKLYRCPRLAAEVVMRPYTKKNRVKKTKPLIHMANRPFDSLNQVVLPFFPREPDSDV